MLPYILALAAVRSPESTSISEDSYLDLVNATMCVTSVTSRARTIAEFLRHEACSRLQLPLASCWPVASASTNASVVIVLADAASVARAEGYSLSVSGNTLIIAGNDERGLLYGVGRLLRETAFSCIRSFSSPPTRSAHVPAALNVTSSPAFPLRGHQLGFRPKTNSYDAWTTEQMVQYIGELTIFGANNIELLPPHTDDDTDSPLFVVDPLTMLTAASRAADSLGVNVSLWYPAMYGNYSDPVVMAQGERGLRSKPSLP